MSTKKIDELEHLRREIDLIDDDLLALINHRVGLAQAIGRQKFESKDGVVYRPEREAMILARVARLNNGPLTEEKIRWFFKEVISLCRGAEAKPSVSVLGPVGTYSELAALQHFGHEVDLLLALSIDEVFRMAEADASQYAVVPVENSTEGGIGNTLDRLLRTPLTICGEIDFRVKHCLLGLSRTLAPKVVTAHQQSLAQCRLWLDSNLPGLNHFAVESNAEAARRAADNADCVAIASVEAAEAHGLVVLHRNIEDQPGNSTRFLVLGHRGVERTAKDKTSVAMSVRNRPGALQGLLAPLSDNGIDMTKVESRPSSTGLWEYIFFIDFEGHVSDPAVGRALNQIENQAAMFKVLGSYPMSN